MDCNTLFNSIQCLRTRKEQLLREVEEVSLEIDIQSTKYSHFLNDNAPIYRLPDEILADIFILVQRNIIIHHPDGSDIVSLSHINASHVSHRWRSIVLATPLLWNTISFHIRPTNNAFERVISLFDAHLLRSAKCFLDIDLHFYDTQVDLAPYLSRPGGSRLALAKTINFGLFPKAAHGCAQGATLHGGCAGFRASIADSGPV